MSTILKQTTHVLSISLDSEVVVESAGELFVDDGALANFDVIFCWRKMCTSTHEREKSVKFATSWILWQWKIIII